MISIAQKSVIAAVKNKLLQLLRRQHRFSLLIYYRLPFSVFLFQRIGELTREEGTTSVDRRRGRQRRVVSASVCSVRCVDRVTDPGGDVHLGNLELR